MSASNLIWFIPVMMFWALVWLTIKIVKERAEKMDRPKPLYFVKRPDGSFSEADPQP